MAERLVDWSLAARTGTALVPPGPDLPLSEAVGVVEDLRRVAARADDHVADVTGLDAATHNAATVVVDRPAWIRANVENFALLADPLIEQLIEKRGGSAPTAFARSIGSRLAGVEVGVLLGYLAARVLGQFELLGPPRSAGATGTPGRLTLVAPNIVATERAIQANPADFRLWVCLHEVTHRTQFAAAPWLHQHVQGLLSEFLLASDLDTSALLDRLRSAVSGIAGAARGGGGRSLVEAIQTPEQRAVLDRITGLMSLLEGHADVVMDRVGPTVVPSVETIRERFDNRRREAGPLARFFRRVIGLEMKLKQYAEGARFVRFVVDRIGMDGLNVVWLSADHLPTGEEIRDPQRWLDRLDTLPAVTA
jgi:coenzyme F420 biosynthesis associated uncharacterized protein